MGVASARDVSSRRSNPLSVLARVVLRIASAERELPALGGQSLLYTA